MKTSTSSTNPPRTLKSSGVRAIVDRQVLNALTAAAAGSNSAEIKLLTLAAETGLHRTTIWKSVRRLRAASEIDFTTRPGRMTSYTVRGLFVPVAHA